MQNGPKNYVLRITFVIILFMFVVYNYPKKSTSSFNEIRALNEYKNDYLINPGDRICGNEKGSHVFIASFNPSGINYFNRRQVMRSTWANQSIKEHKLLKNVFLVGRSINDSINDELFAESETYGDIIQLDFIDSYERLVEKTIFGIKWMSEYCGNAKLIMKVDDDMVVNTKELIDYFLSLTKQNLSALKNKIFGKCKHAYKYPIRDVKDKHYVSRDDYAFDLWPNYCLGPAYILTNDTLNRLYKLSKEIKHIPMEDVYVGMLAEKLKIDLIDIADWMIEYWHPPYWQLNDNIFSTINNRFFLFINLGKFENFGLNWNIVFSKYSNSSLKNF